MLPSSIVIFLLLYTLEHNQLLFFFDVRTESRHLFVCWKQSLFFSCSSIICNFFFLLEASSGPDNRTQELAERLPALPELTFIKSSEHYY